MAPQLRDYVSRTKKPSPFGTTVFICTRLLGPMIAYYILLLHGQEDYYTTDNPLSLSSLPLSRWIIFLMASASTFKHIYWVLAISEQELPPFSGLFFGGLESLTDILNSWLFMNYSRIPFPFTFSFPSFFASSSVLEQPIFPGGPSLRTILGVLLFGIGITIETMSELQRRGFKGDRRNVGKPFKGGLFGLARNINYGGHVLWKMGNALSAGGFVWGGLAGGGYFYDFATRGVPVLDEYCEKKYGAAWREVRAKVPYVLFPGVY